MANRNYDEQIAGAQRITTIEKSGRVVERIRFGGEEEDWGWHKPCHDCGIVIGQFHVPECDAEGCPLCGGQTLGCDCDIEDDLPE